MRPGFSFSSYEELQGHICFCCAVGHVSIKVHPFVRKVQYDQIVQFNGAEPWKRKVDILSDHNAHHMDHFVRTIFSLYI
jgi:hypothetical protein